MLDTIRRAQPAIIKGVLAAVVVSFVATIFIDWGWRRSSRPDAYLAKVSGEVISVREYQLNYNNVVDFYRRRYQDQFTEELARLLNLRQQALDTLIQRKLLLHEAKRQGLTVTDAELIEKVQSYPVFQVNGGFDHNRYLQVLRLSRLVPGDFEQGQREELLLTKLENIIKDGVHVTESEAKEAFLREKEQVNVDYLRVDPAQFVAHIELNEPDLAAYYQEHQERFRKPEQIRVAYLSIDPGSFADQVEITDQRLAQYYEEHKDDFYQEEQVHARHILFKLAPQASPDEEAKVRAEAEAVLNRIQAGEDFGELARQFSQDPASASQGGDLGSFKRGAMVKPFEDAAFALKPNEVSGPVRTDFGYHLIKVEEVQEAGYLPLESVRAQLVERLTHEEEQRLAETKAHAVYEAMITAGAEWETTAQRFGLSSRETPFMARGQAVEGIENPAVFAQTAFTMQEGQVSRPILIGNHYVIMKLLQRKASDIPPFEEIKDAVHDALVQERSRELARQKADALLAEVKGGKSLQEIAGALHVPVDQTGFFARHSGIPKLGRPMDFIKEAFQMAVGEARVVDLQGQPAVAVVKERTGFDASVFEKEGPQVRQRLLRQKQDQIFAQWSAELRRQAEERGEISINENLLAAF
jgi:peptidyl-prolyl cis-trans isomerase D